MGVLVWAGISPGILIALQLKGTIPVALNPDVMVLGSLLWPMQLRIKAKIGK